MKMPSETESLFQTAFYIPGRQPARSPFLTVGLQESCQPAHRLFNLMDVRQRDNAEMVGFNPIKPRSLYQQDFFAHQQIVNEFHVIVDTVHFGIDF